ncbi:hypothetical protein ROA7450_03085 [Roseovarius albus]|uniref:Uncharacterized protein n=1 Tax=Roseovarius albus TaxID=1247867 RepID=A0A1X6ZS00_9RHOB|nr:hypothetical protein [Roseovarius albus]SLN59570.1 hypothetical protein ROA7450_03085 [Roseovarius albus]
MLTFDISERLRLTKLLVTLFLTTVISADELAAKEPAYLQACGVLGALKSNESPFCDGALIGGTQSNAHNCPQSFDPVQSLHFDDDLHVRWYARFWTGKCKGFGVFDFCVEEEGGWHQLVDEMSSLVPKVERPRARAELWAIGRMIGFEWAKRNHLRKISTEDLRDWYPMFRAEQNAWRAMRQLCTKAKNRLGI